MTVLAESSTCESPTPAVDQALSELQAKKKEWTQLSLQRKVDLLDAVRGRLLDKMCSWGRSGAEAKGGAYDELVAAEMLAAVVMPATYIHRLMTTLRTLRATGKAPALESRVTASGQLAVKVFPLSWCDRNHMALPGTTTELVLQPGETQVRQAELYDKDGTVTAHGGRVCVVLGAGNHGFLAVKDALVCLFERGDVAVVKPHPLMAAWQRTADYVMQPLIEAGYVRTLYLDSVAETQQLLYHPLVDCVHMTGGTATHDMIVWGSSPEEQQRRREANDPLLKVPITSELGCVTPFILPGWQYTASQLEAQAGSLALALASNNGCNCNSAKVLVLPADWSQGAAFLEQLRAVLREMRLEPAYYPGIEKRYAAFKERYPNCEVIEAPARPTCRPLDSPPLPYLINVLDELPADPKTEYAFNVEPFAPVLTVLRLPTRGPVEFLAAATSFANDSLWGTLSCMLVLHPGLEKAHPEAVQKAIDGLRYGVVSVNTWSALSFVSGACTWGAFVGDQTLADVGSGLGVVGNPYLLEGVQKAVVRVPLEGQAVPKPPHKQPMPLGLTKAVAGYMVGGWWGLVRGLRAQ